MLHTINWNWILPKTITLMAIAAMNRRLPEVKTEQEHHRGRPLGSLSETFTDEAVDSDCPCVIEPWKYERRHKQSSAYRSDEVHYIGQIGIETQFGRANKSSRADGRPGRSNCHEPAWHRASGNEIIFNISVVFP